MRTIHLSASSIQSFRACPTRYRFANVLGLRLDRDSDSQRSGTNWHALHECYEKHVTATKDHEHAFAAALEHLTLAYHQCPEHVPPSRWAVEREILARSFAAYHWYYSNERWPTVHTELSFRLPVHHPKTGMPLPVSEVIRVGRIDRIIRAGSRLMAMEYKSTSQDIAPDSDYWGKLRMDVQVSMYAAALEEMQASGEITADAPISGTVYDVWRKPDIRPRKLTQAESKEFVENGEYCDERFDVVWGADNVIMVNGSPAEFELGKKEGTFAIRETTEMFGARLLADMYENPDQYFVRQEIVRTSDDVRAFRTELYHTYQTIKQMEQSGHYFHNEANCFAPFRCAYTGICPTRQDAAVLAGHTPVGFKRLFNVTVKGK